MKRIAIIPARSGSKGLKDKNILPLGGIPLMAHTIRAALQCELFERIIVSTDSPLYARIARQWGAEAMMRNEQLASDEASTFDVVRNLLHRLGEDFDELVLLQPTSPLRTAFHIREAVELFEGHTDEFDFLVSVKQAEHTHELVQPIDDATGSLCCFNADFTHYHRQHRHEYSPNGAIFIAKPEAYLRQGHFFGARSLAYRMTEEDSIDIDTATDLIEAEALLDSNPYRQVAVLGTSYSLFYYLLLTGEEGLRHTYFVLTDGVPRHLRRKLPHLCVPNHYDSGKPVRALYRLVDYLRQRQSYHHHHLQGLPIYGHDHLPASLYFTNCRHEPFYLIEDGTHNYVPDAIHLSPWAALYHLLPLGPTCQPYGHDPRIRRVYLTGIASIPGDLQSKTEVHDLMTLWQEATPEYRHRLVQLFDIPVLPADGGPYHLLITQPLSEDGLCTEAEKTEGYRRAMAQLPAGSVLVKPHPREVTDYSQVFPEARVLSGSFPVEAFLILYADRIADVYSVDSSCLHFIHLNLGKPVIDVPDMVHLTNKLHLVPAER